MKKKKKISSAEIERRKKQSKMTYQINNIDKIYKDNARKQRELFFSDNNIE